MHICRVELETRKTENTSWVPINRALVEEQNNTCSCTIDDATEFVLDRGKKGRKAKRVRTGGIAEFRPKLLDDEGEATRDLLEHGVGEGPVFLGRDPVHHRTATVHVRCTISFVAVGAPDTVRCPLPTVGVGHASPADYATDHCAGCRWLTGQSGEL